MDDNVPPPVWQPPTPAAAPPPPVPEEPEEPAVSETPEEPAAPSASPPPPPSAAEPAAFRSVVITEPPKQRHTALWVVLAVLAVAGLGVGAFFALRGDDDPDEPTFSFELAIEQQHPDAAGVHYELTMTSGRDRMNATADFDIATGLARMSMDADSVTGGEGEVDIILDPNEGVMYMEAAPFEEMGAPVETEWIVLDVDLLTGGESSTQCLFGASGGGNPLDGMNLLSDPLRLTDLGRDDTDDEALQHYEVVVDPQDWIAADDCLKDLFEQSDCAMPDDVTYEVWVTEDNEVRRFNYEMSVCGEKSGNDYVVTLLDESPDIEVPDPDDVTDFEDLI